MMNKSIFIIINCLSHKKPNKNRTSRTLSNLAGHSKSHAMSGVRISSTFNFVSQLRYDIQ